MTPPVLLFPDLDGAEARSGAFVAELAAAWPDAEAVALVNGTDPELLASTDWSSSSCHVVVSPVSGLAPSLPHGYLGVAARYPGRTVVSIDTVESPVASLADMVAAAERAGDAVGDIAFGPGTLREGSADESSQLDVFPTMFARVTDGAVSLTGAHGFQAWRGDTLLPVVTAAQHLWDRAAGDTPMRWAFDAAMALGALRCGFTPEVLGVAASELRDRPRQKIADQFDAVLRVCLAYRDEVVAETAMA